MSSFPHQLITTDTPQHGNCCCASCPNSDDCEDCPDFFVQAPTISFVCDTGSDPPCGGSYSPPLITVIESGGDNCIWLSIEEWCDLPSSAGFFVEAGCGFVTDGGSVLLKGYIKTRMAIFGPNLEFIHSLFVNFTAPAAGSPATTPSNGCLPVGLYTHLATWVQQAGANACHPVLNAPVGDAQVIGI